MHNAITGKMETILTTRYFELLVDIFEMFSGVDFYLKWNHYVNSEKRSGERYKLFPQPMDQGWI